MTGEQTDYGFHQEPRRRRERLYAFADVEHETTSIDEMINCSKVDEGVIAQPGRSDENRKENADSQQSRMAAVQLSTQ
jgi:hypothetical protein